MEIKSTAASKDTKRLAIEMYLEGLGFNSIARIVNVSHVSVMNWVEALGWSAGALRSDKAIEVVEIDEMHTYIGEKKLLLDLDCC